MDQFKGVMGRAGALAILMLALFTTTAYGSEYEGAGFKVLDSSYVDRPTYTLHLVEGPNAEAFRAAAEVAASDALQASGVSIVVAPGTVSDHEPSEGEILVRLGAAPSGCTGAEVYGCTYPILRSGARELDNRWLINGARMWLNPVAAGWSADDKSHLVEHELGHALGLAHYEWMYEGTLQVMNGSHYGAVHYASGDRNGLMYLNPRPTQPFDGIRATNGPLLGYQVATGKEVHGAVSLLAGTSPSVAYGPSAGYVMAFNQGSLSFYNASLEARTNTGLGMADGTSPSVAGNFHGSYVAAFQSNVGELWAYPSSGYFTNTHLGMKAGTSPSIAVTPDGQSFAIAFQSNKGELWIYPSSGYFINTHLGMMPGTSPSIAFEPDGSYVVTFQSNVGELWTYPSSGYFTNTHLGMKAGTSPSIAASSGGGYMVTFQSNVGELWTYPSSGYFTNTHLGMRAGTSPSIAAESSGNYVVAFQSNAGQLWNYWPTGGYFKNSTLSMSAETSPAVLAK
ncbi:MAG TPA: hypothetical protein VH042_11440 [Solirubrobacterales bacterium]|nr:hypothetical protein [Solirubrobacterales bacterium]